jgi:hypothetical protein
VPPQQHKDYVFIHGTYTKLMKKLEEEPGTEVTAAVKCTQSQILNWQLMSIERALFDAGDIKEHDALMPLTYLRSGASAAGAWGDIPPAAPPPGCPAAGGGAAGSAAAAASDDADGDAPSDGDKKKKPNKKKKRMTLASMEAWTRDQWVEWDRDNARYVWSYDYEYDVKVKTDEGDAMLSYPEPAKKTLIDAYFSGLHRVEFSMTITHGRHAGSVHDYVVYWIDANEGFQFNPQNATAAVRKVVLTRTPWPVDDPPRWWNPESGSWEECRGWSW